MATRGSAEACYFEINTRICAAILIHSRNTHINSLSANFFTLIPSPPQLLYSYVEKTQEYAKWDYPRTSTISFSSFDQCVYCLNLHPCRLGVQHIRRSDVSSQWVSLCIRSRLIIHYSRTFITARGLCILSRRLQGGTAWKNCVWFHSLRSVKPCLSGNVEYCYCGIINPIRPLSHCAAPSLGLYQRTFQMQKSILPFDGAHSNAYFTVFNHSSVFILLHNNTHFPCIILWSFY